MNHWFSIIVGNLLIASLIAGIAWYIGRSGRQARLAHLLWLAFFVKLVTPPLVMTPIPLPFGGTPDAGQSVVKPRFAEEDSPAFVEGNLNQTDTGSSTLPPVTHEAANNKDQYPSQNAFVSNALRQAHQVVVSHAFRTALLTIWFAVFIAIIVSGVIRFVRLQRLVKAEGKLDEEASLFVQSLIDRKTSRSGTGKQKSKTPKVLRLPMRVSPMLLGFGPNPVIVCPDPLWNSLSEDEQHVLLAHEAAHFCRSDHIVRWFEWAVTAVYWWFPGVYFARQQLERHEEACCDAWAVKQLDTTPRTYAKSLLQVVDFICDHGVGIPRLASGMHPTDSLAERLRLLMQPEASSGFSNRVKWVLGAAIVGLWVFHPDFQAQQAIAEATVPRSRSALYLDEPISSFDPTGLLDDAKDKGKGTRRARLAELPEPPQGFWTERPPTQWASESLTLPHAKLSADAATGIRIEVPNQQALIFTAGDLSAIVEMPSTHRVVIGDDEGRVRLWDLSAGTAVSLIGKHPSAITSLAYHPSAGLFSADSSGTVIRWDLQSGTPLATWTSNGTPVQSIRLSLDGHSLAVLLDTWNSNSCCLPLSMMNSETLEREEHGYVTVGSAIALELPQHGWVIVDWAGVVRGLYNGEVIATVPKHRVSALRLSQNVSVFSKETIETKGED